MARLRTWRGNSFAGACLTLALLAWSVGPEAQPVEDLGALDAKVSELRLAGKYPEALGLAERYVAESKARFGETSPEHATALASLAETYFARSSFDEAEPIYQRVLAIRESTLGPLHDDVLSTLAMLANIYRSTRRPHLAEPLLRRILAQEEQVAKPDPASIADTLKGLAEVELALKRFEEAEAYIRRALALSESAGENPIQIARLLVVLAQIERRQGRLEQAASTLIRALTLHERAPPEAGDAGLLAQVTHIEALVQMAALSLEMKRFEVADEMVERVATLSEKALGPDHPIVAGTLEAMAVAYERQNRLAEAEGRRKRAIAINERAFGKDHINVALSLLGLGNLYGLQYRFEEAFLLLRRGLSIAEASLGPENPALFDYLASLGELYLLVGNWDEAELSMTRALSNLDKAQSLDRDNSALQSVRILKGLAYLRGLQGRHQDARPFLERALATSERTFGPHHDTIGDILIALAVHALVDDRLDEAERLFERALPFSEKAGRNSRSYANNMAGLGMIHFKREDWAKAHAAMKTASSIYIAFEQRAAGGATVAQQDATRPIAVDEFFLSQAVTAYRLAGMEPDRADVLGDEAFQLAQRTQSSQAAAALNQMAARFASGTGPLSAVIRERQDLAGEWQAVDRSLTAALTMPPDQRDSASEEAHRARLVELESRIASLDGRLAKEFPQYAALASPQPLSIEETQNSLAVQEVLVFVASLPTQSLLWVIGRDSAHLALVPIGKEGLAREVAALRCGLDHTLWRGDDREDQCVEMLRNKHRYQLNIDGQFVDVLPFDLERAHGLYNALLAPVEELIKGKHVFVVPSGPLTSLSFNVLVTEPPKLRVPNDPAQYRHAAWLGTRQPISVLPTVASLKALRAFAKASHAIKPYLGVGNPLLDGPQNDQLLGEHYKRQAQAAREKRCAEKPAALQIAHARGARSMTGFGSLFRGSSADIEQIRGQIPLPETADELCEIGRRLGVPESEILLGPRATEALLKDLSDSGRLAEYAIVHFATHGALTGQVSGRAEPGLILTPPPGNGHSNAKMLERDDGFLTASEIAGLKLDADWVMLSACNTAGASGETAEALSGMARAFFYAGARALLVSHWEVGSAAAVKLTTHAFAEMNANPHLGRSEAFRTAMRALIEKGSAFDAHPSQWAPFVVVGEGAAAR